MPTLAPVGTMPAPCGRLGSSGLARAFADDHDVLVALHARRDRPFHVHRVEDVDVVVDHDHVLEVHHRERREQRVLGLARLLLDRDHRVPERAAAERDVDVLHLHAGGAQRLPDRGVARRRREPGVLPRHVQVVVDRVLAHRDRLDAHQRVPVQPAHQPRELAEAAFRPGPAGRQDLGLEHDLGVGDVGQVDGRAGRELDRRAAQAAGDRHLVDAERRAIAGADDLDRMRADARSRSAAAPCVRTRAAQTAACCWA